ncbi:hypothetical protein LPJ77_000557 [Coemansia sp. RSA 2523]|nr:hypothetical protein LPJ77_000557 [Coemansia sp. RSA 2523]
MSRPRRRVGVVPCDEANDNGFTSVSSSAISAQLRLIESSKATERARGVQELASMLREDQRGKRTLGASIPANTWELVVSWTAGILIKESQTFINKFGTEWPLVSAAGDRLSSRIQTQYAVPVRHIWVAAMLYLSPKLARFLTKHITESIATDPCLVHVFGLDYAKVLRAWAAHVPHVRACKDGRALAVADWCMHSLARTNSAAESQMSTGSATEPTIMPGDVELASTLLAVVKAATLARLAGLSDAVLDFCAEYCRLHARENACMAMVLDTLITVLLATADVQLVRRPDRICALLESVLQLWPTRTPHLKLSVLHSTRVLTRLVAIIADEQSDPDARALLELALKTMTGGVWDRHGFMQLPRVLLDLWPLLDLDARAAIAPTELFALLHNVVDAATISYFDTVAFLAALLTRLQIRATDDTKHRRKRSRKAPTSLSRLITALGSDDAAAEACGAAQVIWYVVAVYPHVLGARQGADLLGEIEAMVQNSDMSQRGDLAEWMLGILHALAQDSKHEQDSKSMPHVWSKDIWQHAVAGIEAGLAGAASLAFAVLGQSGPRSTHIMCQQAAAALAARTAPYDTGSTRLLLFLAQYVRPGGNTALAKSAAQAILQVCETAAQHHWPPALFANISSQMLGFADQPKDHNSSVFGPDWNYELRFAHVLHALALLSDSQDVCMRLLRHHMQPSFVNDRRDTATLSISPGQWQNVCTQLLQFIERCTASELGQALATAVPYVAHTVWQISEHVSREAQLSDGVVSADAGAQIAHMFGERFMAFVAEAPSADLVWQTMQFIAPWAAGYSGVAVLSEPMDQLLTALFASNDAQLLCTLAAGDAGSRLKASSNTTDMLQARADTDGQILQQHAQLEARMLSASVVRAPGANIVRVLKALAAQRTGLTLVISSKLAAAITQLDDVQFLLAAEVLARCCVADGSSKLLSQLKERVLSFLDNYTYTGHMPTVFCALRVVCVLLLASTGNAALEGDEDLARFVAWLDSEAQHGRIDPWIEVELVQVLVGPWTRATGPEFVALSILETPPVTILVRLAQTARSAVTRLAAEEQLARLGLALPFVHADGRIAYPDAPNTNTDDELVLMTRNFGLVLLVCDARTMVPGVMCILLTQLLNYAELPVRAAAQCRRLPLCMARGVGFDGVPQLAAECAADVLSVDVELHATIVGLLGDQHSLLKCQINAAAALVWMLRGEFKQAREALSGIDAAAYPDDRLCWLLAHTYAATEGNTEQRTQIVSLVLDPFFTPERVARQMNERSERIVLQLLELYCPQQDLQTELRQLVLRLKSDSHALPVALTFAKACVLRRQLPQWGQRYSLATIRSVLETMGCTLTDSLTAWLALHIELRIHEARSDDRRERLALALVVLVGLSVDVLDSEVVSAVLSRVLSDTWVCGYARTAPLIGLAAALVLDRVGADASSKLVTGMAGTLTRALPVMSASSSAQVAGILAALLNACNDSDSLQLLVGQDLELVYDWTSVSAAVTCDAVQRIEDRLELARLCERAACGLSNPAYADACAEFVAGTTERIMQLALPSMDANSEDTVRVDVSATVAGALTRVRRIVVRHLHEHTGECSARATTLLLRAIALLRAMSDDVVTDDLIDEDGGVERLKREGDVRWLVCDAVARPISAQTTLAAVDAAARLDGVAMQTRAAWLDARHKQLLRAVVAMPPPEHKYIEPVERSLDLGFLETLCGDRQGPDALAELVGALAARPECVRLHASLGLVRADAQAAARLLPHVIHELLVSRAPADVRSAAAAFLLDFAHNWSTRAPGVARTVIMRTLQARQLNERYADIREFVGDLPLALFEMADLAAQLGQPEAAAFLLECDLTCTGAEAVRIDEVSGVARELLRTAYGQLGNAAAARLLGDVATVDDVQRRCRDAGDWRTLLLYQEAAPARSDIGDTLVHLGLLNAVRPGGTDTDAMNAAAWRLARWDEPALPLELDPPVSHNVQTTAAETQLYRMFRLRAHGQVKAAAQAAQAFMATPQAVAALTAQRGRREAWAYYAVAALLPLVAGSVGGALGMQSAERASMSAMFVLARSRGMLGADALAPAHVASLTLHEIALREGPEAKTRYAIAARAACVAARQAGAWQTAMNHVFRVRTETDSSMAAELRLWEAETLWDAGSRHLAVEMLQAHKRDLELVQQTNTDGDASTILLSRVILTVGEWSAEQRTERAAVLWDEYFNKAAQLLQGVAAPTAWTGRALHALAGFAERQCAELTATRDNDAAVSMRTQKARELAACRRELVGAQGADASRLRAVQRRLEVQAASDQRELAELRAGIGGFLRLAVWAFARCLECTDAFDLCAYPLIALIVTHSRAPELHAELEHVDSVPSHKLLPLARQLCARLSTDNDAFHAAVRRVVARMAADYPHHTLSHLFALCNADRTAPRTDRRSTLRSEGAQLEQRRSDAATAILHSVAGVSADLKQIVGAVDELCSAYIELAVATVPEKYRSSKLEGQLIKFDARLRISRLRSALPPALPVLTAEPRADAPRDYTSVPFVTSLADGYSLAGGINLPKILRVLGSDGRRYKQLVKGKDDLRQDAVIQQLFSVINRFLAPRDAGSQSGAAAGLRMRTYQVVPLTKRCGVLQWVDNTLPFGNWFRGNETKYRPTAPSMSQLRATVHAVHAEKAATAAQKREVFDRVCSSAPPIFRFFFYQHFHDPRSWFERRETYIRSAAVASVAGWALGIGDRHLQNILVDQTSAEIVHIDLGIAFDLGKLLPIPELVPFRLTREMVDGMGLLGLDGSFRHACQATLHAMRDNSRVVITILNVLKVDPLYLWSLIPLRIGKIHRNASMLSGDFEDAARASEDDTELMLLGEDASAAAEEENKEAGRSITHVGQRLSTGISVEGQISELIQQATDPTLLSRMFEGWSAWY